MNKQEIGKLLTLAALVDNRTVTTEACLMWHEIAGHLDYDDAVAAMQAHYQNSTVWLMPAHVIQRVAAKRRALDRPKTMSPEVPDDCGHHKWLPNRTCLYCTAHQPDDVVCPDGEHAWMRDGTCRNCPTLYADVA